jgi:hypothetical protein
MRITTTRIDALPVIYLLFVGVTVSFTSASNTVVAVEEDLYYSTSTSSTGDIHPGKRSMMHHPMVGGYAPITNIHTNERVQEISQYVLESLIHSAVATHSDRHSKNIYSFQSEMVEPETAPWNITVVAGKQQVVAGMNYHLTIVIAKTSSITPDNKSEPTLSVVGGLDVIVYDQFGNLSVTRWGTEISIKEAKALLAKYHHHKDNDKDDDDGIDMTNVNAILDSEGKV